MILAINIIHLTFHVSIPSRKKLSTKDIDTTDFPANPNHLLFGKNVVFSGAVQGISREKATSIVQSIGGLVEERVTKRTNYVISGIQDPTALCGHKKKLKNYEGRTLYWRRFGYPYLV